MKNTKASSEAKPKKAKRVISPEESKTRSAAMKTFHAKKKKYKEDITKGGIPIAIPQDIPQVGNHYVYDIKYEKVGWRRMILPVPFNVWFPWRTYNVSEKMYFGDVPGCSSVEVLHFHVFSLRARAYIPLYESIYSPWVVKQHIRPDQLISDISRIEQFANTQKVIAGTETQHMIARHQSALMIGATLNQQIIDIKANIKDKSDDLAADMIEAIIRGEKPPSEMMKTIDKIKAFVEKNWGIIVLALIAIAVWIFILLRAI